MNEQSELEPQTEAEQRAWRMSLKVGDEVAIIYPDCPEWGQTVLPIIKASATRLDTSWINFQRETGMETTRTRVWRIVPPTAEGKAQRERYEAAQAIMKQIRAHNLSHEPIHRLKSIAWILGIAGDPAPGFDHEKFDREERADTLEALASAVELEQIEVHGFSGSYWAKRSAAASIVNKDGGDLHGLSLRGLLDVPTGNEPGSEDLAHLIAYALRSIPDYIRLLRSEQRNLQCIDQLLSMNQRLRGSLSDGKLFDTSSGHLGSSNNFEPKKNIGQHHGGEHSIVSSMEGAEQNRVSIQCQNPAGDPASC